MASLDYSAPPAGRVLSRTRHHLHLLPAPPLRRYVSHYSITFPSGEDIAPAKAGGTGTLTLIPDLGGCLVYTMGRWKEDLIWGAYAHAVQVAKDFEVVPLRFFVEFQPGGAAYLLGLHMKDLADHRLGAGEVCPALHAEIRAALDEAVDVAQLLCRVDCALLRLLYRRGFAADTPIWPLLGQLQTTAPVRELADITGYSERQLGRIFHASIGLGVKTATRVVRINRFVQRLRPGVALTHLAEEAGYFDQAHLNHDFRALCGVSPTQYLQAMSDFYNEQHKL